MNPTLTQDPVGLARCVDAIIAEYFATRNDRYVAVEPVVLPSQVHDDLSRIGRRMIRLAATLAQRLAPTPAHFADLIGRRVADEPLLPSVWLPPHREVFSARPDCVVANGVVRVVELNCHSAIGGVALVEALGTLFLGDGTHLVGNTPFAARLAALRDVGSDLGAPWPKVAILGSTADPDVATPAFFENEARWDREAGADVTFVDLATTTDLDAALGDADVLLRIGMSEEWVELAPEALRWLADNRLDPVGLRSLVVSDTGDLLEDKAVLHHLSVGVGLTAEERAFCDRHLPWTRLVRAERTSAPDSRQVDLVEYLLARRESLVLKPCAGRLGRDVLFGSQMEPESWAALVAEVIASGARWIAQHAEVSDTFPTQVSTLTGERLDRACAPVLSPLLFGDHDGGVFTRFAAPGVEDRVVSMRRRCVLGVGLVRR